MSHREIHYLGHSAFEVLTDARTGVLIDPYITGNATCPYTLDQMANPDVILISHGALDHLGDGLELALRAPESTIVADPGVIRYLRAKGIPQEGIRLGVWGFSHTIRDVSIRVVESRHLSIFTRADETYVGLPLGFMVWTEGNGAPIYHPGDTSIFTDMKMFADLYKPQIGMLLAATEMTPQEGALAAKWLNLKYAIPMHYRGEEPRKEFGRWIKELAPETTPMLMQPGERVKL